MLAGYREATLRETTRIRLNTMAIKCVTGEQHSMNIEQKSVHPIILCHGLFGSLSDNDLLSPYGERLVFAPDLLGYGDYKSNAQKIHSLIDQAEHVLAFMDKNAVERANLVGHSVGGAVAALLSINHPERVNSLVSVEGNMTPPDAFWSASLAMKSIDEIQQMVDGYRADVAGWIAGAGVRATPDTIRIATDWLDNQSAETLKAQARAVTEATSEASDFLIQLRTQLANGLELHLIAGSLSRDSWYVPADIEAAAKSVTVIPDCGHLMMLESPAIFAQTVLNVIE